jgi:hypothetical protein
VTDSELEVAEWIEATVTQGGINNNYVALAPHIEFFPADVIGPADGRDGSGALLTVRFAGTDEEVLTDISGRHLTFRRRSAWGRFFACHGLGPGDRVIIERRSPYAYDVRPAGHPARLPAPGERGSEWSAAEVSAIVADYLAMLAAEADGLDYSKASTVAACWPGSSRGALRRLSSTSTPASVPS